MLLPSLQPACCQIVDTFGEVDEDRQELALQLLEVQTRQLSLVVIVVMHQVMLTGCKDEGGVMHSRCVSKALSSNLLRKVLNCGDQGSNTCCV